MKSQELTPKRHFIVRLEKGEDVNFALEQFAAENGLGFCSVQFIGAVTDAKVGYWDVNLKKAIVEEYPESREILGSGNISIKEGKHFAHLHAFVGDRDKNAKVGHLASAVVAVTLEAIIQEYDKDIKRTFDPEINYMVWDVNGSD